MARKIALFILSFAVTTNLCFSALAADPASKTEPLVIHAAAALTGLAAPFGSGELNAYRLAFEEANATGGINGRTLTLAAEDTHSTVTGTVNAVQKLVNIDGAKLILGPSWLDSFQGPLAFARQKKVLLLTPSAAAFVYQQHPGEYPLVFSTFYNLALEIQHLIDKMKADGIQTFAIVIDQDPFFTKVGELIRRFTAERGIKLVVDDAVTLGTQDFRAEILRVKKAKAAAALFALTDDGSVLSFLKQRGELAADLPLYGTEYLDGFVVQDQYRPFMNGIQYVIPKGAPEVFQKKYREHFGSDAVFSTPSAYAAAKILVEALRSGAQTPEDMATYFRTHQFASDALGQFGFDEYGGISNGAFVIRKVTPAGVETIE